MSDCETDPIEWGLHRDDAIYLWAPLDVGVVPNVVLGAATVTAILLDRSKDTALDADEAGGQTVISVASARRIEVGDVVRIELDDRTVDERTVDAVDTRAGTIDLDAGLTSAARKGAAVSVKVGPTIALALFGTPSTTSLDSWGYVGEKPHDHAGVKRDHELRVEVTAVEGSRVGFSSFDVVVRAPGGA